MDTEKLKELLGQHGADVDTMRDVYMTKAQREAYERLLAELAAARKNEARYQFLRDGGEDDCGDGPWSAAYRAIGSIAPAAEIDAKVDTAMEAQP